MVKEAWHWAREKPQHAMAVLAALLAVFLLGTWLGGRAGRGGAGESRKILYYVDPMNPAHTSTEPGLAPCGMKMEPVYADQVGEDPETPQAPGTVRVSPRKQQLIGVRLARVEKAPHTHTLRALGRVAVDERLIYRVNSAVEGWIREVGTNSTGSVVKKDETLAIIYSPEFLAPIQAYLYMLSSLDRFQASGQETPAQLQVTKLNLQQYLESLRNLGMSDLQIKELEQTRRYTEQIRLIAPATSFVLARNVSPGQRFDRGVELYRLADLSRVWVLADLFENESLYFRPGDTVRVVHPYQKRVLEAVVSDVLPQFDAATRTLKVRLEVNNQDFALRPDMFVDVEFAARLDPALTVPLDAVLDSGQRRTVFVHQGKGFFEPRQVETGWRLGDRVEIVKGLEPGEEIVVSGNFLLDSESRMQLAAAGLLGPRVQDPVCRGEIDAGKAKIAGRKSDYQGKTFYFCSDTCKAQFDQDPARYLKAGAMAPPSPAAPPPAESSPAAGPPPPPAAQPEPLVESPPPGWRPPVIPPAAPLHHPPPVGGTGPGAPGAHSPAAGPEAPPAGPGMPPPPPGPAAPGPSAGGGPAPSGTPPGGDHGHD
jgi:RND family efflux transporter MFP subunit